MTVSRGVVGVLGGSGDVGLQVVRCLHRAGIDSLRVGGRNLERAQRIVDEHLDGTGGAVKVEATDERDVAAFAEGCQVVVNAAGPSCRVGQPVAHAVRTAGAHLVDVAGDDPLYAHLTGHPDDGRERAEVLSAGLQPGLSALLPRHLAGSLARTDSVRVWFAILDHFTEAAADDYLEGTTEQLTEPLAAWRAGERAPRALRRTEQPTSMPGMSGTFSDLPVLTTESERLAASMGLTDGEWHTLMAEGRVSAVLDRIHTMGRDAAREALCLASRIDMAGRLPAAALLAEVRGHETVGGPSMVRAGHLHGPGTGALAGAAASAAVLAVLAGEVPYGVHYAAEVLDPARTIQRVCALSSAHLTVVDGPVETIEVTEEGAL